MADESPPTIDSARNNGGGQQQSPNDQSRGDPKRRRGNSFFDFLCLFLRELFGVRAVRHIVLAQKCFLIQAEIVGDGTDKSAVEDTAGKLVPVFVFEGLQKTRSDARCLGDFLQRNLAQFPLAF